MDPGATPKSLFFELIDRHPNLIALKADGVTKELSFFGGRVGFLSLGFSGTVGQYFNEKICGLVRGSVGSPLEELGTRSEHLRRLVYFSKGFDIALDLGSASKEKPLSGEAPSRDPLNDPKVMGVPCHP